MCIYIYIYYTPWKSKTKQRTVIRMIHGFGIPNPTNGQSLVDLDFLGIYLYTHPKGSMGLVYLIMFIYLHLPYEYTKCRNLPSSHGIYGIHTKGVQPQALLEHPSEALLKCWRHQAVISFQTSLPLKFLSDVSWRSQPDSLFRTKTWWKMISSEFLEYPTLNVTIFGVCLFLRPPLWTGFS